MTCRQLGGACDKEFHAETFEEIAELSRKHGIEMYEQGDEDHVKAMKDMKERMKDPKAMEEWMKSKRKEFNALPENK